MHMDLITDLLHNRLLLCHNHYGGRKSIVFNGVNGNGSIFHAMHKVNDLYLLLESKCYVLINQGKNELYHHLSSDISNSV